MAKYDVHKNDGLKALLSICDEAACSTYAAKNDEAIRRKPEKRLLSDYRMPYSTDGDRILHSLSYTRYIDKTQVFYLIKNDHISHRVLHVQFLSKIARTIARYLKLNEDLIEAIALGHDIGHAPFGHDGELFLTKIALEKNLPPFLHNVWSVRFLDYLERGGTGLNLCLATLDGILTHDGEIHAEKIEPFPAKTFETLYDELRYKLSNPKAVLMPMTLEACVVRMADTISYIGRDIEDAILLKLIERKDLPEESTKVLGDTMGTIVFTLVTDIIMNSAGKPHISMSSDVSHALMTLKNFNLNRIYLNPAIKFQYSLIEDAFHRLFEAYLGKLRENNVKASIFKTFLNNMNDAYKTTESHEAMVIDFIAGMTDRFFVAEAERLAGIKLTYETDIPRNH